MKNFALTGVAGYVAPRHLRAIKDTGNNLIAAIDPHDSVGVLDSFFPQASFFTEIERFDRHLEKLRRSNQKNKLDYLSVCSPNHLHDAHMRLALRLGANVICEKPLVLNPWNLDLLEELEKDRVLMAIFSNKYSSFSRKLLKSLGLDAYFSAILGPDSLPYRKPSPEPILKLLRDFHLEAREGIIVGDSMNDILAGKNAGVATVGCSYGYGNASELADADYHIASLPELLKLPLCDKLSHRAAEKAESTHRILKGLKK